MLPESCVPTHLRATFIPPSNDHRIIAGQATAALELLEGCPGLASLPWAAH